MKAEVVNTEVKAPEAALKDSEVEAALSFENIKTLMVNITMLMKMVHTKKTLPLL